MNILNDLNIKEIISSYDYFDPAKEIWNLIGLFGVEGLEYQFSNLDSEFRNRILGSVS